MTQEEYESELEQRLTTGIHAEFWATLSASKKSAAKNRALQEVSIFVPGLTLEGLRAWSEETAILAEQCAFTAKNAGQALDNMETTSESVDGVSVSYQQKNAGGIGGGILSPLVAAWVETHRKRAISRVKFIRG